VNLPNDASRTESGIAAHMPSRLSASEFYSRMLMNILCGDKPRDPAHYPGKIGRAIYNGFEIDGISPVGESLGSKYPLGDRLPGRFFVMLATWQRNWRR
jgi:hypothetical protein